MQWKVSYHCWKVSMKSIVSLLKSINEKYRITVEKYQWKVSHHCWKVSMKSIASLLKSINEKYRITVEKYQWKVSYHCWKVSMKSIVSQVSLLQVQVPKIKVSYRPVPERAEKVSYSRMSFYIINMKNDYYFKINVCKLFKVNSFNYI